MFCADTTHALDPKLEFLQYQFHWPSERVNLPSEIIDAKQDQQGFLWLATARGLIRFDGLEAKTYRLSDYDGLLSSQPTRLFVDSQNRLLVASERGTSLYDGTSFTPVLVGNRSSAQARAFAEGPAETVWIATDERLLRLDGDKIVTPPLQSPPKHTRSLLWHDNRLYIGGRGTLMTLRGSSLVSIELPSHYSETYVRDLELHQGRVWGATGAGLFRVEGETAVEIDRGELHDSSFDLLLSDRDGNLWFTGRDIFGRIYPDGSIETPDVVDETLGYGPEISALVEDVQGQQWHASRFFGLASLYDTPIRRVSFPEGLPSTNVTALTRGPEGAVFVATDRGISTVSGDRIVTILREDFLRGDPVLSMNVDDAGRLWFGTGHALRALAARDGDWSDAELTVEFGAAVNVIVNGAQDELWIGTDVGLYCLRAGAIHAIADTDGLAIDSLLFDSHGTLWLGTEVGLGRIADDTLMRDAGESLYPFGSVVGITELASGEIAAATTDQGVFLRRDGEWHRYGEEHGLPTEQIIDVESRGRHLWIISAGGVFRAFPPLSADSELVADVLPVAGNPLYRPAYPTNCCRGRNSGAALLDDDQLTIASDDGIVILDTSLSVSPEAAPRPYVKAVLNAGNSYRPDSGGVVTIDATDRDVQIDYSAVQLANSGQVRFRYRLHGLSEAWVDAERSQSAHFLNLPPGRYAFELQASLHPDAWVGAGLIALDRPPALLETTAFRVFMWTAVILAGLGLIWLWLQIAKVHHRNLEAKIDARTTELNSLNAELRAVNEELLVATETDPLTGLMNRRFFSEGRRTSVLGRRAPIAGLLAVVDIDLFRRVNDRHGHAAGDDVIREFASTLQSVTSPSDFVIRWGGEEFLIICSCSHDDAEATLNRLCAAVREHSYKISETSRVKLSCSIGGVRYPLRSADTLTDRFQTLLEIADAALFAVKMNGRDGWAYLESARSRSGDRRHETISIDLLSGSIDRLLLTLIAGGQLTWNASRKEITLAMTDKVTRLPTLEPKTT